MPARKFTVTHPDGTVSTRTSKTRIYTHAVEAYRSLEAAREALEAEAAAARKRAEAYRWAAKRGTVTRKWRGFDPSSPVAHELQLDVPGEHPLTWYCDSENRPSVAGLDDWAQGLGGVEFMREYARHRAADVEEQAGNLEQRAAELTKGEGYSVLRWSQRRDLAERAVWTDLAYFARTGYQLRVVEVDHE